MISKVLKIIIPFFVLFFSSNILAKVVEHYPILTGDVKSLSFENNKQLSDSIIKVIKNFADEKQINKIKQTLLKKDNLNINPHNYSEIVSLLPLPSKTIIRIINNNFSEGLYNFFAEDLKKEILISYGEIVNIQFEVVEIKPSNIKSTLGKGSLIKSALEFPKTNNLSPIVLAPALAAPLFLGGSSSSGSTPNNPPSYYETTEYTTHYGLASINASDAYSRGYTGNGVTVSVMDNTFDTDHPDLVGVFTTGYNALDASTNVHCEDNTAMNGGSNSNCTNSHGTHVAGTIAANKDDSEMHGVAYDATIKPIVMADGAWDSSSLSTAELINGIGEGTGSGIAAMNNSWGVTSWYTVSSGGTTYYYRAPVATSSSLGAGELAAWEAGAADTVIVFANGNHGMNTATGRVAYFTAANTSSFSHYEDNSTDINDNKAGWYGSQGYLETNLIGKWLTVVNIDSNNIISSSSNGCGDAKNYCICAPGDSVYSTVDTVEGRNYNTMGGTSMAAPHVTGAIAILKQQFPNLTSTQLVTLLIDSATDLGATGVDNIYGVGMLNLAEATKPAGTAFVAAYNANVANGGSLGTPTPSNTSINFSSPFGSSFKNQNISFGILDSFNRSYIWNPKINYSNSSGIFFENFIDSMDHDLKTNIDVNDNTKIAFSNQKIKNNSIKDIHIEHKINRLNFSFNNEYYKNNIFNISPNSSNLRFSKIQSTDNAINNLSTTFELNNNISLTSAFAKGKFNNSNEFNESSIDFNYHNDFYSMNYGYGTIVEQNQFLGTQTTGAYKVNNPSITNFIDINYDFFINKNSELTANYSKFNTVTDMAYKNFINISDIESDEFKVGIVYNKLFKKEDKLIINYILPLSSTKGNLTQYTTKGYQGNGSYNSVVENYSLVNENREQKINLMYKFNLNANANYVSAFSINKNYLGQENNNNFTLFQGMSFAF
tara:strand:- start:618 stop:3443 length:2826 start_codon:yes stop_codon:yes gene_type:complete